MSLFGFSLKPRRAKSAQTAKDRLQFLLAHERRGGAAPQYLAQLQRDIVDVIRKYVKIDEDAVDIRMRQDDKVSSIEVNVELPESGPHTRRARH